MIPKRSNLTATLKRPMQRHKPTMFVQGEEFITDDQYLSAQLVSDRVETTMTNLSYYFHRKRAAARVSSKLQRIRCQSSPTNSRFSTESLISASSVAFLLLFLVLVIPQERNLASALAPPAPSVSTPQPIGANSHHSQVPSNSLIVPHQVHNQSSASRANATSEFLLTNLVKNNFKPANGTLPRLPGVFAHSRPGQKQDHVHHQPNTKFACEGNRLDLSCEEGKMLHLVRATYGRFSLSICNELNHINLNVGCTEWRAFLIMQTRCDKLSNCSVEVSKELFGDPCEGTSKYLEVQYYCDDVNGNHNQQQQQQASSSHSHNRLPANQAAAADQVTAPGPANGNKSPPTTTSNGGNGQLQQQQVGGQQQQQVVDFSARANSDESSQNGGVGDPSMDAASQLANGGTSSVIQQFCMAQTSARNLLWNHTLAGQVTRRNCPEGSTGKASWRCDPSTLRFSPAWSPDFTRCKSNWLQRLALQLDQMLEAPGKQPGAEWMRQQNEQILKVVLSDLALMAKTKELFSEDLKRVDIMLGQIIAQMRSLSVLFARAYDYTGNNNQLTPLYDELFSKITAIVSSLFDIQQKSAWLEVQTNEHRRYLELRFLDHLKESGALLAYVAGPWAAERAPLRQPNVLAGITVIPGLIPGQSQQAATYSGATNQLETNEFNLQPTRLQNNLNRFVSVAENTAALSNEEQPSEFRIQLSTLQPLIANGITRFLVLDVKKPDYALIRQQLETAYGSQVLDSSAIDSANNNPVATGDQQWTSRVFGVFAIVGESGDLLDGHANNQQEQRLSEVLAESPISVDFKVPASGQFTPGQAASRQCNSLSDNVNLPNRCQTYKFNATDHICRCTQFGFVALTTTPNQVPNAIGQNVNMGPWPQLPGSSNNVNQFTDDELRPINIAGAARRGVGEAPPTFIGAQKQQPSGQQTVGFWTTIFIVFGLSLLVVSLAAFVIQTIVRINSQTRLNKKQGFLSAGSSILGHNRDLSGGPTTGPLTDHNLMGQQDPLTVPSAASTNHSTSIIGLTQPACHGYKTHQQLYAAHYPTMEPCDAVVNKWRYLTNWLKPSRWLAAGRAGGKSVDHFGGVIQHRVIGSTIGGPMSAYKSQFQNGYTTSLHHQGASTIGASSQLPLAAPSSSTSSYVSSSAYYEEIGPGNLTKVNPSQLASANGQRHTIVEPFKRPAADQQQLLTEASLLHQHQQQPGWSTMNQQNNGSYGGQRTIQMSKHQHLHNDLNHLQQNPSQSSTSSGNSSQHSASTNITNLTGAQTPRHYLFASPQAVSAYESSMSQMNMHNQHHHQQPATQQQYFSQQQRFMPSGQL